MMQLFKMLDIYNTEIKVGDVVVVPKNSTLHVGKILKISKGSFVISCNRDANGNALSKNHPNIENHNSSIRIGLNQRDIINLSKLR